jgi:hypothetical protein
MSAFDYQRLARKFLNRKSLRKGEAVSKLATAVRRAWPYVLAGGLGLATPLWAADASLIYTYKAARYDQTGPATVQTAAEDPFRFEAGIIGTSPTSLIAGSLAVPGDGTVAFTKEDADLYSEGSNSDFDSLAGLEAAWPAGTYTFTIQAANDGTKTVPLSLPATSFPNAPRVTNLAPGTEFDATQPLVVKWEAFAGGTAADFVVVQVRDRMTDDEVFGSPLPGSPGALPGTATQLTIPANTLQTGKGYELSLSFGKVVALNTTAYPGVMAVGFFMSETSFALGPLGEKLSITSMSPLPAAFTNQSYAFTLSATGGVAPYRWEAISGTLPLTYSLSSDGELTGGATTSPPGDYAFRVRVWDASGSAVEGDFILPVTGAALHYTRFGDESGFVAAAPPLVTLDFEEYAGAADVVRFEGNEYEGLGIRIVCTNTVLWVAQPRGFWNSCLLSPGELPYVCCDGNNDSLTLIFDPPTQAVGWRFVDLGGGSGEGIYLYDTNSVLLFAQDGLPGYGIGTGNNPYWGIVFDDKLVARVEVVEEAWDGDDVAYDNIRFSATVPLRISTTTVGNGSFQMRVTGPSGASVVWESSANLKVWTPFQTNAMPPRCFLDLSVPLRTNQEQFFRARRLSP